MADKPADAAGVLSESAPQGDDLIEAQYSGDKGSLRPIYDKLAREIARFGKDVEFAPKKAYESA